LTAGSSPAASVVGLSEAAAEIPLVADQVVVPAAVGAYRLQNEGQAEPFHQILVGVDEQPGREADGRRHRQAGLREPYVLKELGRRTDPGHVHRPYPSVPEIVGYRVEQGRRRPRVRGDLHQRELGEVTTVDGLVKAHPAGLDRERQVVDAPEHGIDAIGERSARFGVGQQRLAVEYQRRWPVPAAGDRMAGTTRPVHRGGETNGRKGDRDKDGQALESHFPPCQERGSASQR
jgi:hypothetical protein